MHFIGYFHNSQGMALDVGIAEQISILRARGVSVVDGFRAAIQRVQDNGTLFESEVVGLGCTTQSSHAFGINHQLPQYTSIHKPPQLPQVPLLTPPRYTNHPQTSPKVAYPHGTRPPILTPPHQAHSSPPITQRKEQKQVVQDEKLAKMQDKSPIVKISNKPPAVRSTSNNSAAKTPPSETTSTKTTFNPCAPVFKPAVESTPRYVSKPPVASKREVSAAALMAVELTDDVSTTRRPFPQLPESVVENMCFHLDLETCIALADTSTLFKSAIRKAENTLIRDKVQTRIPWATSLEAHESEYTSWFDYGRVVVSRARRFSSNAASWACADNLDSIPRSDLTFIDPVDAQGRMDFEPLFEGAFLMPFILQRDGLSVVHLQGNCIFTDYVSLNLKTFKVQQAAIKTEPLHTPKKHALFTPRGTKMFVNNDHASIQFVDENDRVLWIKDGETNVFVDKSCAFKTEDGILKYDREHFSSMVSSFEPGFGKLLGGGAGFIGLLRSGSQYQVCYFDAVADRRQKYCLTSFSADERVLKTMEVVVFNGMLHINLFNTMVPF